MRTQDNLRPEVCEWALRLSLENIVRYLGVVDSEFFLKLIVLGFCLFLKQVCHEVLQFFFLRL